jgi:hypothetical protein
MAAPAMREAAQVAQKGGAGWRIIRAEGAAPGGASSAQKGRRAGGASSAQTGAGMMV